MRRGLRAMRLRLLAFALLVSAFAPRAQAQSSTYETGLDLRGAFAAQVDRRFEVPEEEARRYAVLLEAALAAADLTALPSQFFVLIDRSPYVQAAMIYWQSPLGNFYLIGASPASTGLPGEYEHFETPLGVFDHMIANPDYRAEGTFNELGIRGLGREGMRVYDFGWQKAKRGWGSGGESAMRLLLHATDPQWLEEKLGRAMSKGCIRIPATLDEFIDRYGILDADYERAASEGRRFWVLRSDRDPTPWSGRYLVIVDTARTERPEWARPRADQRGARWKPQLTCR